MKVEATALGDPSRTPAGNNAEEEQKAGGNGTGIVNRGTQPEFPPYNDGEDKV